MRLRPARLDDLPLLEQWSRDFEQGAHGEPFIARTLETLEARPERGELLVIEDADGPVGYTILATFWSNEFRGEALILDELYVSPERRGGAGARALAAIEARARARGVKLIALEVLPDASRVHSLYRRAGYRADRTLYQKRLSP